MYKKHKKKKYSNKPLKQTKKNGGTDKLFKDVKPSKDIEIISGMLKGYNYDDDF